MKKNMTPEFLIHILHPLLFMYQIKVVKMGTTNIFNTKEK